MTGSPKRLHHIWCEPIADFFQRIDEFGGWPLGMKFVSFHHSDERHCEFGGDYLRTGWWTTVASADDYYWWKISDGRKAEISKELRQAFVSQMRRVA